MSVNTQIRKTINKKPQPSLSVWRKSLDARTAEPVSSNLWIVPSATNSNKSYNVRIRFRQDFYDAATAGDLTNGFEFLCDCKSIQVCNHALKVQQACRANWQYLFDAVAFAGNHFRGERGFYAHVDNLLAARKNQPAEPTQPTRAGQFRASLEQIPY